LPAAAPFSRYAASTASAATTPITPPKWAPTRREPPFFFSKPADALVPGGGEVAYPPATSNLQHEVELVVALAGGGADIPPARALDCVYGYAVGLDLTRRDLQQRAKDKGHPWDMGKGFDQSAPIGCDPSAGGGRSSGARFDLAQGQWPTAPEWRPRADVVEGR
jgi:2-keto-4-pentenoate hydratase/2-oxohepta-3-ene-1,7-dioic acid hydratase in catechol pathway